MTSLYLIGQTDWIVSISQEHCRQQTSVDEWTTLQQCPVIQTLTSIDLFWRTHFIVHVLMSVDIWPPFVMTTWPPDMHIWLDDRTSLHQYPTMFDDALHCINATDYDLQRPVWPRTSSYIYRRHWKYYLHRFALTNTWHCTCFYVRIKWPPLTCFDARTSLTINDLPRFDWTNGLSTSQEHCPQQTWVDERTSLQQFPMIQTVTSIDLF